MATINVTPKQFADLSVSFLLDKILHPDEVVSGNKEFDEFTASIKGKGMKSALTQYYIKMDSQSRLDYKRIKDIFDGSTNDIQNIKVVPEKKVKKKDKKEKEGFLKKVGKAVLKKLIGQGPLSLSTEEWNVLNETIEWMDQIREENKLNG
jgi:hypothetical protein